MDEGEGEGDPLLEILGPETKGGEFSSLKVANLVPTQDFTGTWVDAIEVERELGEVGAREVNERSGSRFSLLEDKVRYIVNLHMDGVPMSKIAHIVGLSSGAVNVILKDPYIADIIATIREDYKAQFQNLLPRVVEALREGLSHSDIIVRMRASQLWLNAMAMQNRHEQTREPSAEELIRAFRATKSTLLENKSGGP